MGIPSVRELRGRLTSHEVTEWLAFYLMEPWDGGPQGNRGDIRSGIIAATVANVNRSKDSEPFTHRDFMPNYQSRLERQRASVQQQMAALDIMNATMGRPTFLEENELSETKLKEDM